jgi:hypothetical protein
MAVELSMMQKGVMRFVTMFKVRGLFLILKVQPGKKQ